MVKMIDNYTLTQVIGQGVYGKVYRAKNIKTNHEYAIKIIPSDKLHQNSKLQQCTMNQVQTLTMIGQTDHIIMYYQMLKTKNNYYFVYEYCNGGTLMQLLGKEHHLEEKRALDIFKQLLDAFKVLNRLNIMHRDLKPENIFFSDNKVKLGDFGFCKGLRPEENLTKTMLGSPIYMAPQVLKGQAYSTKADIWSLGVILYEMLYGVCPFQSSSIAMLINTINSQQISLPSSIKISDKTQQLLKKLLTKDYFRRIGWIQLFNWFGQQQGQQKQNMFKTSVNSKILLDKKASLVEEWATKNKISELNVKERSVSQDIAKKDIRGKFDMGSLENISPVNMQEKTTPFTPKLGQENKNGEGQSSNKQGITQQKSFSVIRQPLVSNSPFQAYRKPASLPKRQTPTNQDNSSYGHNSCYKPESNKKIFYSQNYQNIFTTPITQKSSSKINDRSIEMTQKQICQLSSQPQGPNPNTQQASKRPSQRLSITKNSLVSSRATSTIQPFASTKLKQLKSSNIKLKRSSLLQIHEMCLTVIKETFKKLELYQERYLKVAYMVVQEVNEKLKDIVKLISVVEIDLLDVSSLINYEILNVERMVADVKEQLELNFQAIPQKMEDIAQVLQLDQTSETKLIRDFLQRKLSLPITPQPQPQPQQQSPTFANKNSFSQNISIVNMLPKKSSQQQKQKYDSVLSYNQEQSNTVPTGNNNKFIKGQYYTTNEFAQYYRNLVESKEKNTGSKISMLT